MGRITIFNIFGVVIFAAMGAAVCAAFGDYVLWGAVIGGALGFAYPLTGRLVIWMLSHVDRRETNTNTVKHGDPGP